MKPINQLILHLTAIRNSIAMVANSANARYQKGLDAIVDEIDTAIKIYKERTKRRKQK